VGITRTKPAGAGTLASPESVGPEPVVVVVVAEALGAEVVGGTRTPRGTEVLEATEDIEVTEAKEVDKEAAEEDRPRYRGR